MTLRMRILFGSCSSVVWLILLQPACAAPLALECPAKYPDLIQMQALREKGWSAPFPGRPGVPLEQMSVSLGPADENGELQGERLPGDTGERFHFHGLTDELEKWIFCGYSMPSGYARLMYRIPVSGQACVTRLKRARGRLVAASIRCE